MMRTAEHDLRRLDALVAEKVMGWSFQTLRTGDYWVRSNGDRTIWAGHWAPTTSWDHAGQVVERMRELEFGFELHRWNTEGMRHPYEAKFYPDAFGEFVAEADSAPLAIVLAALRALGAEAE